MQRLRETARQTDEYQPTAHVVRVWRVPLILRLVGLLMLVCMGSVLVSRWSGALLPEPGLFAYEVAERNGDVLYLYDTQYHMQLRMHQSDSIRGVKWTPDGSGLIVADDTQEDWYAVELDGGRRALRRDEVLGTSYLPAPDWSRYVHVRADDVLLYSPLEGREAFVPLLADVNAREVVWSPDSTKLAVSVGEGEGEARHIGIIDIEAGRWTEVTDEPALYARLQWSPDSERLAYLHLPDTIHVYDTATETTQNITSWDHAPVSALAWSPDGDTLAYAVRGGPLMVRDLPDGELRVLLPRLAADTRLAWGPDGPWLIVRSGNLVEHTVTLVNVRNGEQHRVPLTVSSQGFMAWRP